MEITLPGADQFVSLLLNFAMMQFNKKSFMKTPQMEFYIRVAFAVSFLVQLLICLYIKKQIAKANNQSKFKYKPTPSLLNITEHTDREVEISFAEYDKNEITSMIRTLLFQSLLYCGISWKFGSNQSLIVLTIAPIKNMILSPLYRAYLFGCHIERPYEKNLLFAKCTSSAEPVTTTSEKKKKKEE